MQARDHWEINGSRSGQYSGLPGNHPLYHIAIGSGPPYLIPHGSHNPEPPPNGIYPLEPP